MSTPAYSCRAPDGRERDRRESGGVRGAGRDGISNIALARPSIRGAGPAHDARAARSWRCSDADSGELAALLPLVVRRERGHAGRKLSRFRGFGLCGADSRSGGTNNADASENLWVAMRSALDGVDVVRLTSMPRTLGSRPNPLALVSGAMPARHSANRLDHLDHARRVPALARQEVSQGGRALLPAAGEGGHAGVPPRRDSGGNRARLRRSRNAAGPAPASGGRRLRRSTGPPTRTSTSACCARACPPARPTSSRSKPVARSSPCLIGPDARPARLRFCASPTAASAGITSRPAGSIVVEAMRYFLARGVSTFDMGIGDYAFKRGFGIEPEPLVDLVAGLTWRGKAVAALHRAKARAAAEPKAQGALADRRPRQG